jgi:signal transduction histidine kinase
VSEKRLLGVLALERRRPSGFDQDDEALVKTVAPQLSLGLERFKQQQEISFNKTIAAYNAWASDMAHEINAEAANIQGWAYLIKEYAEESPAIQQFAGNIEQSVRKLLMASPRSDQGRTVLPLDQSLEKFAGQICQQKDIALEVLTNAPGISVEANPLSFQRILRHLIHNAERAMRGRKEKKIILRTQAIDKNLVEIQMQDFGPGIPDKIRPFIFQTNVTTKGGGGNGLLITRQLVEEMNGTIRLLPANPRKGAIFSIKLPIYNIPKDHTEPGKPEPYPVARGKGISNELV